MSLYIKKLESGAPTRTRTADLLITKNYMATFTHYSEIRCSDINA